MMIKGWKFWKWHICRCRTESDDKGIWGQCVICGEKYGYVTRGELRAYADAEIDRELRKRMRQG